MSAESVQTEIRSEIDCEEESKLLIFSSSVWKFFLGAIVGGCDGLSDSALDC